MPDFEFLIVGGGMAANAAANSDPMNPPPITTNRSAVSASALNLR